MRSVLKSHWTWIILGACVLAGVACLRFARTDDSDPTYHKPKTPAKWPGDRASPVNVTQSASNNPPIPPSSTAEKAEVELPKQFIRLRRPDGTYEVVEETLEIRERRDARMREADQLHDQETSRFKAEFRQTLKERGPEAALLLLGPLLRTPERMIEDEARVYEAIRLAVEIQKDLGLKPGTSTFERVRADAAARLASFFTNEAVSPFVKKIGLAYLAGRAIDFNVLGERSVEIDGLQAYDPAEPLQVIPGERAGARGDRQASSLGSNPALKDPVLGNACQRLIGDTSAPPYLRAAALRALGNSPEILEHLDLSAGLADPSSEVREATVDLLAIRPGGTPPSTFFALLQGEQDPQTKQLLFERLSGPAFAQPQMLQVLTQSLPIAPSEDDRNFSDALYRATVLRLTLQQYSTQKDASVLSLLAGRLNDWSQIEWRGVDSPIVTVAENAALKGLKEFVPHLKAVVGLLPSPVDRQRVQVALARLD